MKGVSLKITMEISIKYKYGYCDNFHTIILPKENSRLSASESWSPISALCSPRDDNNIS